MENRVPIIDFAFELSNRFTSIANHLKSTTGMLLVLNTYLWKSSSFILLLTGAWYIVDHWTSMLNQIHSQLKHLLAIPPANDQQSTWPGEANGPLDADGETP